MAQDNPVTGAFTGTGTSDTFIPCISSKKTESAFFNVSVWGTFVGTVQLQRSFDGGTTWIPTASYTAVDSDIGEEPEDSVLYRFECTAYTSGTINYRLSQ